jgi:hypothetical protein
MSQQQEQWSPTETRIKIPRPRLSLDDLDHDPERDRPMHIFPEGFDRSVPQRAPCGTLIHPTRPSVRTVQGLHTSASSASMSCPVYGLSGVTRGPHGCLYAASLVSLWGDEFTNYDRLDEG